MFRSAALFLVVLAAGCVGPAVSPSGGPAGPEKGSESAPSATAAFLCMLFGAFIPVEAGPVRGAVPADLGLALDGSGRAMLSAMFIHCPEGTVDGAEAPAMDYFLMGAVLADPADAYDLIEATDNAPWADAMDRVGKASERVDALVVDFWWELGFPIAASANVPRESGTVRAEAKVATGAPLGPPFVSGHYFDGPFGRVYAHHDNEVFGVGTATVEIAVEPGSDAAVLLGSETATAVGLFATYSMEATFEIVG